MATKLSPEEYKDKYGDLTGVIITTPDGKETRYTTAEAQEMGISGNLANIGKNTPLYATGEGKWTLKQPMDVSISLDKNTGKITIKAPQSILDRESFQEVYGGNTVLENLSRAYQLDPKYKFPDPDDETKSYTVEDLISKFNEAAKQYASMVSAQEDAREQIRKSTGNDALADRLTEPHFTLMSATGTGEEDTDSTRIAVPKTINVNFFDNLKKLTTYDPESGTVERGDFAGELYNLSKTNWDDIPEYQKALLAKYAELSIKTNPTEEDVEEFARVSAMLTYIQKNQPESDFWATAGIDIAGVGAGAGTGLALAGAKILSAGEAVYNFFDYITQPSAWGKDIKDMYGYSSYFRENLAQLEEDTQETTEYLSTLHRSAAVLDVIANLGTQIAVTVAVSKEVGKVVDAATKYLGTWSYIARTKDAGLTELAGLESGSLARAWQGFVATSAGVIPTGSGIVDAAKTILAIAKTDPTSLVLGTQAFLGLPVTISSAATGATVLTTTLDNVRASAEVINSAVKTLQNINTAGSVANLISQIMVDVVATEPDALRKIVEDSDTEDVESLIGIIATDTLLYAAGLGVAELVRKFPTSIAGQTLNTRASQKIKQLEVAIGNADTNLKSMVLQNSNFVQNIKSASKRQVAEANMIIRQANNAVAKAGKELSGLDKTLAIQVAQTDLVAVQNAIDEGYNGIRAIHETMVNPDLNPELKSVNDEIVLAEKRIIEAEKIAGITTRENYLAGDWGATTVLTNDYRGALTRTEIINNYKEVFGYNKPGQIKELNALAKIIESFESRYPDLAKLAKESVDVYRKAYKVLGKYEDLYKLRDAADILSKEESGLWKQGFVRTQRLMEYNDTFNGRAKLLRTMSKRMTTMEDQHYVWGGDDHFVSPLKVFNDEMLNVADVQNSRNRFNKLTGYEGAKRSVVVTGEDYKNAQTVNKLRKDLEKTVNAWLPSIGENIIIDSVGEDLLESIAIHSDKLKALSKVATSGAKAARAKVEPLKVTRVDRKRVVENLGDADTPVMAVKANGVSFTDINEEQFDGLIQTSSDKYSKTARKELRATLQTYDSVNDITTKVTYDNFRKALEIDADLAIRMDKAAIYDNKEFINSDEFSELAEKAKREYNIATTDTLWREDMAELSRLTGMDKLAEIELNTKIDNLITEFIYSGVLSDSASKEVLDAMVYKEADPDLAREYIVLYELYKSPKSLSDPLQSAIRKAMENTIKDLGKDAVEALGLNPNKIADKMVSIFEDKLYDRRNNAAIALADTNSPLVDQKGIFAETRRLMKQITEAESDPKMVQYTNDEGLTEIAEVDPMVADLITYKPTNTPATTFEAFMNNRAFEITHRLFRLGTTGLNAKSMMNQTFRDGMNGFIGAGSILPMSKTEKMVAANFGARIANDYRNNFPDIYDKIKKTAEKAGRTVEEEATRRVMAIGESYSPQATETEAYRIYRDKNAGSKLVRMLENATKKMETPNELRERYYRKTSYAKGVQDALAKGFNTEQAIEWGKRVMYDATTDFARKTYHLQAFSKTVPYLAAAVNGSKSFWRLFSLDPVGVSTRIITGIIIPVVVATVATLSNEENREQYRSLYEYEKDNNLIFFANGEMYEIPIPQEIGSLVSPWRQLIEKLYDANRHDFAELLAYDIIGLSPYDLSNFQDIDGNTLAGDPTFLDRTWSGFLGLFSQFSPAIVKSLFEWIYGVDPYTGKPIDKSYTYIDENGDLQIMDYTTSELAKAIGAITGWSPAIVAETVSNIVGQTGLDLIDSIISLGQFATSGGREGSATALLEKSISNAVASLTITDYDRTKSAWNSAITALYDEKQTLMEDYEKYTKQINMESNVEKRQKLIAKRDDYIAPFLQKVKNVVTRLQTEYGGSIDTYRFASVVSLVNFDMETGDSRNAASRLEAQEEYYTAKESARRTIERMGISSPDTTSLLGYLSTDASGNTTTKYYTPLEILNAQSIYYTSRDIHQANLEGIIKDAGLTNKWTSYYAATTKAERKKVKAEWNGRVIEAIYPYVRNAGVDAVLNNSDTVTMLEKYLWIDNLYNAKNELRKLFTEE